jgi:molybdopterin-binding protein
VSGDAFAVVHPHAVAIHRARPAGTPRNVFSATIRHIDPEGDRARVTVAGELPITAEVTTAAVHELALSEGALVWVSVKATEVNLYAA